MNTRLPRRLAAAGLTLAIPLSGTAVAQAHPLSSSGANTAHPSTNDDNSLTIDEGSISPSDADFIDQIGNAAPVFQHSNGVLTSRATDQELRENYNFTEEQLGRLHRDILGKPFSDQQSRPESTPPVTTYISVQGKSICLANHELKSGIGAALVAAAEAGPEAVAAALEGIASVTGGPVGAVIGGIITAASAPSLVEIGGRAVTAAATNRGLKIGVHLDYPPVYADYC